MAEHVEYSRNAYCVVDVIILPNASSSLWKTIEKDSNPKLSRYQHSHLLYGICINECKRELEKFEVLRSRAEDYRIIQSIDVPAYMIEENRFIYGAEDEMMYGSLVNKCVSKRIKKQYDLSVATKINYCNGDHDENLEEIGIMELAFILCLLLALILNIAAFTNIKCFQKFRFTKHLRHLFHYDESAELQCIHSIKFYNILLVIVAHCVLFYSMVPFTNPEFLEEVKSEYLSAMIIIF